MTIKSNEEVLNLFDETFKCIQGDCDGTGCIPNQVAEDEWEAQQCQFHAEYLFPLRDFILSLRKADMEAVRGKVEGMKKGMHTLAYMVTNEEVSEVHRDAGYNQALSDLLQQLPPSEGKDLSTSSI